MKSIAVIVAVLATLAIGTAQDWGKVYDAMPLYAKVQLCFDPSMSENRVQCVGRAIGYDIIKGKENVVESLKNADKKITDFLNEKKDEIKQYVESNEFLKELHDKAHELKGKAQEQAQKVKDWFKDTFGRQKREIPSQALIAKAKQIKICLDMGGDKESCTAKVLGASALAVDMVQLQTVVNYEYVLEELKEYFKFKENGGTLKEFIAYKKQQAANAGRRKREVPAKVQELVNQAKQCIDNNKDSKTAAAKCIVDILGKNIVEAKNNAEKLLENADKKVIDFVTAKKDEIYSYIESKGGFINAAQEKGKEVIASAQNWFHEHFGKREKREMPSQELIAKAKQIKICLDMGGDKAQCTAKVLGASALAVDMVQLQTVVNYEAVLEELKEYFKFKENGGTLKEFIEYKKQQNRPKRGSFFTPSDLSVVKDVDQCLKSNTDKNAFQCVVKVVGSDIVEAKDKLQTLLGSANKKVRDYVTAKKQAIHDWIESKGGFLDKVHDKAHEWGQDIKDAAGKVVDKATELKDKAKDWFSEHFGGKKDKTSKPAVVTAAVPVTATAAPAVVTAAVSVTSAPVEIPTDAPVEIPTEAPVEPPTEAPVEEVTEAPEQPTEAPVEEPTAAPVEDVTSAPVEQPTEAPVEQPTAAPVEEPTETPVDEATSSPIFEPVSA